MFLPGHVRNGVIVADEPVELPEGAAVRIELIVDEADSHLTEKRVGGWWRGQVVIASDFDELPGDIADSFGMR